MPAPDSKKTLPQVALTLLIGLIIVTGFGFGVHALYLPPVQSNAKLQKLDGEQKALDTSRRLLGAKSGAHEAFYKKLSATIAAERAAAQAGGSDWIRNTSIILIGLGALVTLVSLAFGGRLPVFANGTLLGGLLTLLYGAAASFRGAVSITPYLLAAVVLAITVVAAYFRFFRPAKASRS